MFQADDLQVLRRSSSGLFGAHSDPVRPVWNALGAKSSDFDVLPPEAVERLFRRAQHRNLD